jgi:formate-dependent phosphoribosylglycinamide formyltransferase (GAR transformylase)
MTREDTAAGKRVLLLFTTTGYQAASFKDAAEKLGVALVAGSDRCRNLDDPWRDGSIPLRFQNPEASAEAIIKADHERPIDAIIAIGDKPTLTAAIAAGALGLAGNPPAAVRACRDKHLFRERLRDAHLPGPVYRRFRANSDPLLASREIAFPCVLKPLCLSASRGVIRADNQAQFVDAFQRITALLALPDVKLLKDEAAGWILVERYLEGTEVALEGIVDRGRLKVLALFDKPDPLVGPYFEETIYVTPSRLDDALQARIAGAAAQAVDVLGLRHGPIHAEVRLTPEGPVVLEVAVRPIGGLCARALRFDGGPSVPALSLEELIIRHALGAPVDGIVREREASGVMMIPVPAEGMLTEVRGLDEANATPGIDDIRITAKLHHKIVPWPEGSSYLGFIFARGSKPAEVEAALRAAHAKLRFVITPSLRVLRN